MEKVCAGSKFVILSDQHFRSTSEEENKTLVFIYLLICTFAQQVMSLRDS